MTGGRLLIPGGPDRDPALLAAGLARCGRSCAPVDFQRLLSAEPLALPDSLIISLFGRPGPEPLPELLAALDGLAVHAVFLADAGFAASGDGVRVLRGLDADGLGAVLDMLAERDALARQSAGHLAWKQALLNGFSGIVAVCDANRRVVYGNAALGHRAGTDPATMPCYTALHGRGEPCPWCPANDVLAGRTVTMEIQSPLDGRYFSMASAPLRLPGEAPLMLSLFADVTDRNMALSRLKTLNRDLERRVGERTDSLSRQTAELAEANSRLLELDALKSGFLATVTHDLRTPLTSVMGFAKLTRREFLKEFMPFSEVSDTLRRKGARIADNLRIIENEGLRLTRLVNDFLDLSKIEAGRLDWNDRSVDPAEVVRMAVEAVGGEYEQNERLALVVDISGPLPPLRLDPDRLVQVLVNLLTNAARHTFEGEVTLVARQLPGGGVQLRVDDTGPGIEEKERERIFDKFYQARQGDTQPEQRRGTGLGLAICKHIIERYGGAIRAEARLPHGTSFVVELPTGASRPRGGPVPASERTESESLPS
ncbi:Osmosensitive K+ channel histidine kinase KdpD [Desulfovibrio sp. DV]|uniref:sensor histidine kinase n=1 Tax=Desulfovibrio sp. DV TaxID=1844708 RepID=UPI00094B9925|nr:HAMP domain-containing sensor histidine kinase [Desulfovibrio sp. DV]OLN25749.1 Osmosensitive K+ channel histidine kinase KdpD [Desulfovibrio sp. DV]